MTELYGVSCVLSFLLIVIYVGYFNKRDTWFLFTFVSLLICNFGYFTLSISTSTVEALLANRIAYAGHVFLPFFLLMSIMEVCKFKIHRISPYILTLINTIMLLITTSGGYSDVYYKSVHFIRINGVGTLTKEYGSLHTLYYFFLLFYFTAIIAVIFRSFFKKKIVSYKNAIYLAVAVFINISIYFVEKIIKFPFEILSVSYIITGLFLLIVCKKIEDYDIERVLQNTLEIDSTGVILFDAENNFKGCNDDAITVLPDLANLKLEYPIPKEEETLYNTVVSVLKGEGKTKTITYNYDGKIYRIVAKPFNKKYSERGKALGTAIVINDDTAQQEYLQLLSTYNEKLEAEVAQKTKHVVQMHNNLILGMADMVEGRDPNTGGHIKRTSTVVEIFVNKLKQTSYKNLPDSFLNNIAKAAPMHDLGKISIDDAILRKPGKYTDEEYGIMKTHAQKGAEIVRKILNPFDDKEFYNIAANVAHFHHEKYDGTGYPKGLSKDQIPIEARIMALADVFDALVSKRCYKEKYSYDEAFKIIRESLGGHFDPELGEIFLSCSKELIAAYDAMIDV